MAPLKLFDFFQQFFFTSLQLLGFCFVNHGLFHLKFRSIQFEMLNFIKALHKCISQWQFHTFHTAVVKCTNYCHDWMHKSCTMTHSLYQIFWRIDYMHTVYWCDSLKLPITVVMRHQNYTYITGDFCADYYSFEHGSWMVMVTHGRSFFLNGCSVGTKFIW